MSQSRQVFVVVRADPPRGHGVRSEELTAVQKVISTQELAEREVERLTCISAGQRCRYFWQEWTLETPED